MFQVIFVLGLLAYANAGPSQMPKSPGAQIADANNDFGFKLYKEFAQKPGNILISPLSAETVLALTYMGAEGETANQMRSVLSLPAERTDVTQGFQEIESKLKNNPNPNVTMNTANKIYPAVDVKVKEKFLDIAKNKFNADVESLDFSKSERAANTINSWVEDKTNHKIQNLISPDSLSGLTRMVLVNALYFKGSWKTEFKEDGKMPFYLSEKSDDVQQVPAMTMENDLLYGEDVDLDAQIVALPYSDTDYNMLIILPRKIAGLGAVEQQMTSEKLNQIVNDLQSTKVVVKMPKFKIEDSNDMGDTLVKLGMKDAFLDGKANFNSMTDEQVYISQVIQKTFMEVNEKGTEAAAATAGSISNIRPAPPVFKIRFTVNKPFLFVLYQRSTNLEIMLGRAVKF